MDFSLLRFTGWNILEKMYRYTSPLKLSRFETTGFKSLQILSNGPLVFRKRKVFIDLCLPDLELCKVPRLQVFNFLVHLNVGDCNNCSELHSLGQLPCLKYLIIERMCGVQRVGLELYGISYSSIQPFQSLEILIFREMLVWEEWSFGEVVCGQFPRLQELYVQRCPKLKWGLPKYLPPTIKKVEVLGCSSLVIPKLPNKDYQWLGYSLPILAIVEELPGVDSNTVQFKSDGEIASQSSENDIDMSSTSDDDSDSDADTNGLVDMNEPKLKTMKVSNCSLLIDLPPRLQTLTIDGCVDLRSLPENLTRDSHYLQDLFIMNCCYLKYFHGGHPPIALKTLSIYNCRMLEFLSPTREMFKKSFLEYLCIESSCDSLRFLPLDLFPKLRTLNLWDCANFNSIFIAKNHKSLEKLQIRDCPKLLSFPEGGLRTPNLTTIVLSNCKNLKVLPDHLHKLTTLLRLDIKECPELESIPEGGLPCNLHFIRIRSCEKLTPRIEWGMLKLQNLDYFEIEGGCKDLESFPEQNLLPSSIIKLRISKLQKLEFLDYMGIKQLRSLETLMISSCKWLRYLPHHGLSSSLISLYINDCPLLKSDFKNNIVEKKKWFGVDHIPHVQIDTEVIS
ncbi:hypothetical protein LWI29_033478 [Acer saccharum]|uniref:Uncharacterized protein n=1 Tax=Acer saccharum TaxID=4024 RepID=A0AA39VCQ2_ACESA|nr:hypothetical protein LWI29_033478 [Acer saccharum]